MSGRGNNDDNALFAKLIWISFIKKDTAMPLRTCTAASLLAVVIAAPFAFAQAQTAAARAPAPRRAGAPGRDLSDQCNEMLYSVRPL